MGSALTRSSHIEYAASEGRKFAADTTLVCVTCATCGVLYAIPESFYRSMKKYRGDTPNGWKCVCPFGHEWWYVGETELERARRDRDAARDAAAAARAHRDQAKADARAQKARGTRFKNERDRERAMAHAGQCPVKGCRRHFKNLGRHMDTKHPDWDGES